MLTKFLSPLQHIRHHTWLMAFLGGSFALADILTIETFRRVTNALEVNNQELFFYAIIALFVIEAIDLVMHRWFKQKDRKAVYEINKAVYGVGLRSYLSLDNNYTDKMGL